MFQVERSTLEHISRQTTVSYSTCQYIISNLQRLGLLKLESKKSDNYYSLCPQDEFLKWIDEQKNKTVDRFKNTQKEISRYFQTIRESSWKPDVSYHEGDEGIQFIYDDMISTAESIKGWTDIHLIAKTIGKKFMDDFIERRIKNNIESFAIMPDNRTNKSYLKKSQHRIARILPGFSVEGEIRIYGDKVATITFDKKNPVGFIMRGKIIADMYRSIFENEWNLLN